MIMTTYVEMTVEEAMMRCNKNAKVLVAVQNLEDKDCNAVFVRKKRDEYNELFKDVQTAMALYDDLVKQLRLFTEKQNILDIKPRGVQKTILLRDGFE